MKPVEQGGQEPLVIGIDIGATKTSMAFLDAGLMRVFFREATPHDPGEALDMIAGALAKSELPGRAAAIGIGCPGPLDSGSGVVLSPPYLPRWEDFALGPELSRRFGIPIVLENDANAGALGEALHGGGRGARTVFYIAIGSGIGCGIVIDGRIHRGRAGLAGEVWAFYPGSFTGMETPNVNDLCSGTGMVMQARKRMARGEQTALPADGLDSRQILRAAAGGDPLAKAVTEDSRRVLAATISAVLHVLAPDVVVIGGGLAAEECGFVESIREQVAGMIGLPVLAETPVRRAALWDSAVLYGAIELGRALCGTPSATASVSAPESPARMCSL